MIAAIVVMGVAGSGKSTVAAGLAARLGWTLVEADTFHSPLNVEKMRGGTPLTDEDRWPWLDALAARIDAARRESRPYVLACSALRRVYRERLSQGRPDVRFVYLQGTFEVIAARLAGRSGHYMPPSLLQSQFATLEEPGTEEAPIVVSVEYTPAEIIESVTTGLGLVTPS